MIDARDNNFIGQSPCLTCPRHLQGLDKKDCLDTCKRLEAYRNGQSWENEDMVKIDDEIPPKNTKRTVKSSDTLQKTKKKGGSMSKPKKMSLKPQRPKKPNRDKVFKLYMIKYPELMQYIIEVAEKSLLPTKDIFIQLLSEAIVARKRKDGDES